MTPLEELRRHVIQGRTADVERLVRRCLADGTPPRTILDDGLVVAMGEVGRLFECGEFYVPEMLIAARAMKAGLEPLRPALGEARVEPLGHVVIGSVQGDVHDIGKNLVAMMLEGAGFHVVDLGTDVSPERFVEAAREGVDIVAISALLTTTMTSVPKVVAALDTAGLRDRVRVIVGGAQVTPEFAREAGADGYAPDASGAATLARRLIFRAG